MRVLTAIATIFIPLTFIVGVYGMNFDRDAGPWNMPELGQTLGHLFMWLVMIVIAVGMIIFFRRGKWFLTRCHIDDRLALLSDAR